MVQLRRSVVMFLSLACIGAACSPADPPPPARDFPTTDPIPQGTPPAPPRITTYGKSGPVDQAGFHPDFTAFRNEIMRIAETRDTAALFRAVSPDIRVSFGGDGGIQGLRDHWRLSSPDSEIWGVLMDIALHGGKFNGDNSFTGPWTFYGLPDSLDAFTYSIVRADEVPVYEKPDSTSAVIQMLSFDIVKARAQQPGDPFRAIILNDGGSGYVAASKIRSPLDYRATFERRNGRWWLVSLVQGD